LGLFDKVYNLKNEYSSEYPESEWDTSEGVCKYYKLVPIDITDEEYAELLEVCGSSEVDDEKTNTVATVLTVLAWLIFVTGLIAGIVLGTEAGEVTSYYGDPSFEFSAAWPCWIVSFISGIFVLGFSEIIKLLQKIYNKTK
jgi:hypothetical protein